MTKHLFGLIFCFSLLLGFTSCEKDDPEDVNEEELITEVILTMTPSSGGDSAIFIFRDIDGDGGLDPFIKGDSIQSGTTYFATLTFEGLEDEMEVDITEEILEEANEHQVFFSTDLPGVSIEYTDVDTMGKPLGLSTRVEATTPGLGTLTIILRHEPNKDAEGVSMGDITNAGGETDIEVNIPLTIE